MKLHGLAIVSIALSATAHADDDAKRKLNQQIQGLDTTQRGPSQAGAKNCDKAAKDAEMTKDDVLNGNPLEVIGRSARASCTFLQKIVWKAPTVKAPPKATASTPSADVIVAGARAAWAGSDDALYVNVLSGGTIGTWQQHEYSDVAGSPSRRTIAVFHVIVAALANNGVGCYVVYGEIGQTNLSNPHVTGDPRDAKLAPKWSGYEYLESNWKRAEKVSCPSGAKPPSQDAPAPAKKLEVGDLVLGQWSDGQWYPGKIGAVNKDGTFRVDYDDGDVSPALSAAQVRARK